MVLPGRRATDRISDPLGFVRRATGAVQATLWMVAFGKRPPLGETPLTHMATARAPSYVVRTARHRGGNATGDRPKAGRSLRAAARGVAGRAGPPSASALAFLLAGAVLTSAALSGAASPAMAQQGAASGHKRAVVELFTSQGCASCPPADRLICDYARDSSMVVLTLPVTCWDYLGWRDTLAHDKFTKRQRIYAKLRGARRIYTPQVVVNGVTHMVGSDESALRNALASGAESAPTLPVKVDIVRTGETFRVVIGNGARERATILLAPFYREQTVVVDGGENRGSRLSYANVVRDLVPLAPLLPSRAAEPVVIDLTRRDALPDNTDGFAILVQSGDPHRPGRVLGAASFETSTTH